MGKLIGLLKVLSAVAILRMVLHQFESGAVNIVPNSISRSEGGDALLSQQQEEPPPAKKQSPPAAPQRDAHEVLCSSEIPSSRGTGGLIVFFHIPKTGGKTIMKFAKSYTRRPGGRRRSIMQFFETRSSFQIRNSRIVKRLSDPTFSKFMFLEIHGGRPSAVDYRQQIDTFRQSAHKANKTVFVFSILREPVSFSVSYFNYFHFHALRNEASSIFNESIKESTESTFRSAFPEWSNFQTKWLSSTTHQDEWTGVPPFNQSFASHLYEEVLGSVDWIGTTDQLCSQTIPILASVIDNQQGLGANTCEKSTTNLIGSKRLSVNRTISVKSMSNDTLNFARRHLIFDKDIFTRVQSCFRWNASQPGSFRRPCMRA